MAVEHKRRFKWIAILLLLPVLYVLSIGPAFWLFWEGHASMPTIRKVYAPMFWLHKNNKHSAQCIDWYLKMWNPVLNADTTGT
jgi:hypothetical protein